MSPHIDLYFVLIRVKRSCVYFLWLIIIFLLLYLFTHECFLPLKVCASNCTFGISILVLWCMCTYPSKFEFVRKTAKRLGSQSLTSFIEKMVPEWPPFSLLKYSYLNKLIRVMLVLTFSLLAVQFQYSTGQNYSQNDIPFFP